MPRQCEGCGSCNYNYGFHFTDGRGCTGIMCDKCMAGMINYHQNGVGDKCDKCGRIFPPGKIGHYSYHNKLYDWCDNCHKRILLER